MGTGTPIVNKICLYTEIFNALLQNVTGAELSRTLKEMFGPIIE
jgi:hypothetical protein